MFAFGFVGSILFNSWTLGHGWSSMQELCWIVFDMESCLAVWPNCLAFVWLGNSPLGLLRRMNILTAQMLRRCLVFSLVLTKMDLVSVDWMCCLFAANTRLGMGALGPGTGVKHVQRRRETCLKGIDWWKHYMITAHNVLRMIKINVFICDKILLFL